MKKNLLSVSLSLLAFIGMRAQENFQIDFANILSASLSSSDCSYVLDGQKLQLFNSFSQIPDPQYQICVPADEIWEQPMPAIFGAVIRRSDMPFNNCPGIIQIDAINACWLVTIEVNYTDGSSYIGTNSLIIDESCKTVESITLIEPECGFVSLYDEGVWPLITPVAIQFSKTDIPFSPVLIAPENEQKNLDPQSVVLSWQPCNVGDQYLVQVDTTPFFTSSFLIEFETGGSIALPALSNNYTCYWRVKKSTFLCSPLQLWSEVRKFSTVSHLNIYEKRIEQSEIILKNEFFSNPDSANVSEHNVAADGTFSMAFTANRGYMNIRDYDGPAKSGKLFATDTPNGMFWEYTAPQAFGDNLIIYLDFKQESDAVLPDLVIKLNIMPPPVVLLHGLASEGSWWDPVKSSLQDQGWPSNFIATPDYDNDGAFNTQIDVVKNAIELLVLDLRNSGLFVNKVNLVGYSMGGLLGRQYLLENPDAQVFKFVTLNTPHYGSEWANLIDDQILGMHWVAGLVFGSDFNITDGGINSLRVDGNAILNLNSQAGPLLPIHAISTNFTACELFYLDFPDQPSSSRKVRRLARLGSVILGFVEFLGTTTCLGIEYVLGMEHDGIVRMVSQSGGLEAPYHQNYAGIINTFHTTTANQAEIRDVHLPTLLRVSPDESGLFTTGGFVPDILPPPNLFPNDEQTRFNGLLTEVEIEILHPQDKDTVYAQWMPSLQIAGSEDVAGLLALFFYPALDTMLTDSVLWSNSHSFTVPVPEDYEGWVNIGVMGTDGYGAVDFDTLSVFVTQSVLPIPEIPNLLQPADGSTSLPVAEVALEWESVAFAQGYRVELSGTPDFAELIFEQSGLAETTSTVTDLNGGSTYYWRVRGGNSSGEGSWSETWIFTTEITNSTSDNAKQYGLTVYPNPAQEIVVISCSHRIQSVELFDGIGRLVTFRGGDQPTIELSLQGIPSGIYFVKVKLELGEVWEKIVVKP